MFVQAHLPLPLPFTSARAALDAALDDGGLTEESRRAAEHGASFLMRVGPGGSRRLTKQVLVQVLPAQRVGCTVVVPLRWEATGKARRLFPCLDANLTLADAEHDASTLSIVATYRPPLDVVSGDLDRIVLSRAAHATLSALLREIATKLTAIAPLQVRAAQQADVPDNVGCEVTS